VDFYCRVYDDSEHPHMLHFTLDPMKCAIAPNHDKDRHEDSAELAEAMAVEFGDEEWLCLRQYLLTRKRKAIREMDVTKLPVPESPNVISDDGHMVPFGEIFPFGAGFEFELGGAHWLADDHYCVMPDCDCREVEVLAKPLVAWASRPRNTGKMPVLPWLSRGFARTSVVLNFFCLTSPPNGKNATASPPPRGGAVRLPARHHP
jgi:hypothetical protein